jgi:hypothetical protein
MASRRASASLIPSSAASPVVNAYHRYQQARVQAWVDLLCAPLPSTFTVRLVAAGVF